MTAPATEDARRWFAEDLRVSCNVTAPAVIRAFATIPRERFLGPGPWTMRGLMDTGPYSPAGTDPSLVYHNVPIGIDTARDLYNGQPGLIARWLEDLAIGPGHRVLHIGAGTGYFSAIIGHIVGSSGRVWAVDIDSELADRARKNLVAWPWIEVRQGDGRSALPPEADVVLVNAGATHVLDQWLDVLADNGRLLAPLTGTFPAMGRYVGKGVMLKVTRSGNAWPARASSMVAIYSLVDARDEVMNTRLGQALQSGALAKVTRLRRDPHAPNPDCVLHGGTSCLSA